MAKTTIYLSIFQIGLIICPQKDTELKAHRMLAFDGTELGYVAFHQVALLV